MIIYSFLYSNHQNNFYYWFASKTLAKAFDRKTEDFEHKLVSEGHDDQCSTPSFISYLEKTKQQGNQISLVEAPSKDKKVVYITLALCLSRKQAMDLISHLQVKAPPLPETIEEIIFAAALPQQDIKQLFNFPAYAKKTAIIVILLSTLLASMHYLTDSDNIYTPTTVCKTKGG